MSVVNNVVICYQLIKTDIKSHTFILATGKIETCLNFPEKYSNRCRTYGKGCKEADALSIVKL